MVHVRRAALRLAPLIALLVSLSGCRLIGGILKAGVLAGVIAIVAVAFLIVGAVRLLSRPRA
jgi:hypothetical protein